MLFLCENNLYAMGTPIAQELARTDISARAESYGMVAEAVDGMDVLAVEAAARTAAAAVRSGAGPRLLELRTYRYRAHSMADPDLYRTKEEIQGWKQRDPTALLERILRQEGALSDEQHESLEAEIAAELDAAIAVADAGPLEPIEDLLRDVHTPVGEGAP